MSTVQHPAVEDLWERYALDPFTGTFYTRDTGTPLRGAVKQTSSSYKSLQLCITIGGKRHYKIYSAFVHAWVTGAYAPFIVDHVDRNPFNNAPWNLRALTVRGNRQNSDTFKGGAYRIKTNGRWRARVWVERRFRSLGCYATQAEAQAAYAAAVAELER